jgi:hypothetical protein
VLLARIHRHSQFTRPDEPPLPSCASGCRCSAWGSRHQQSGFQRVRAHPESRACCTVGRSSQCSRIAPYHVSRSLCIAFFHYPLLYPNPVAPIRRSRRTTCRRHFRTFHRRQQWRYPIVDVAFRMFLIMKPGGRHICRKPKMLAIIFIAALGQPPKLISGYTWSPNPFTLAVAPETPVPFQARLGSTRIFAQARERPPYPFRRRSRCCANGGMCKKREIVIVASHVPPRPSRSSWSLRRCP